MQNKWRMTWLFDLDNTLHNASAHIFPHINRSMTAYLMQHLQLSENEANALRMHYWQRYGATLLGLTRHHGTQPDHFLAETHRFPDLDRMIVFDRALRGMLHRLPGRKIVFSNGPRRYVREVVRLMRINRYFDDVFGIEDMRYHPKPSRLAFQYLLHDHRLNPSRCILVEDSAENLKAAKRLGMKTVLIGKKSGQPAYVDLRLDSVLELRRAIAAVGGG